jgi:hypothetical protein
MIVLDENQTRLMIGFQYSENNCEKSRIQAIDLGYVEQELVVGIQA